LFRYIRNIFFAIVPALLVSYLLLVNKTHVIDFSSIDDNPNKVSLCSSQWEKKTLPDIEELKTEAICKHDKSTEVCKFLMFPEKFIDSSNSSANTKDKANPKENTKASYPDSSDDILKTSKAQAIRALKPVVKLFEGNLQFSLLRTLEDFVYHTRLHKDRVDNNVVAAYDANPDEFHGLKREQVKGLGKRWHDNEKLYSFSDRPEVGGRPYYQDLHENLGKKITDRDMINSMNKVGDNNLEKLFKEIGLEIKDEMPQKQKELLRLQQKTIVDHLTMADETDRMWDKMTSKVEYRFRNGPRPRNAKYFAQYPKTVTFYDGNPNSPSPMNYYEIVKGSEFTALSDSKRYKLIKEIRLGELKAYKAGKLEGKYAAKAAIDLGGRGTFYLATSILEKLFNFSLLLDLLIHSSEVSGECGDLQDTDPLQRTYTLDVNGQCVPQNEIAGLEKFLFMSLETKYDDNEVANKQKEALAQIKSCSIFKKIKADQDNSVQDLTCNNDESIRFVSKETGDIVDIELKNDDISKLKINMGGEMDSQEITLDYLPGSNSKKCLNQPTYSEPCVNTNRKQKTTGLKYKKRFIDNAFKRRQQLSYQIFKAIKACKKHQSSFPLNSSENVQ